MSIALERGRRREWTGRRSRLATHEPSLVPNPADGEAAWRRFRFEDIADLPAPVAEAEAQQLRRALARILASGRPRAFWSIDGALFTDAAWFADRLRALDGRMRSERGRLMSPQLPSGSR